MTELSMDLNSDIGADVWLSGKIHRANKTGIFSETVTLTPQLARQLLSRNDSNRNIKPTKLEAYKADIIGGKWQLNGEPVILSREGLLNDGQHRCAAVSETNSCIDTVVTFGVGRQTRTSLDQGSARSPGDYLRMEGLKNVNNVAAVAKLILTYDRLGKVTRSPSRVATKADVHSFAMRNAETIQHSLNAMAYKGSQRLASRSLLAFCHMIFSRFDADAADTFFQRLIMGDQLSAESPIFLCRDRLLEDRIRGIVRPDTKVELIFRAWNHWRQGVTNTKLRAVGRLPYPGN